MKKFIVSGICTTVVCFLLSSFAPNSNNIAGADGIYAGNTATYQDTTHKKSKKMDKKMDKSDTSSSRKAHKEKKPAQ